MYTVHCSTVTVVLLSGQLSSTSQLLLFYHAKRIYILIVKWFPLLWMTYSYMVTHRLSVPETRFSVRELDFKTIYVRSDQHNRLHMSLSLWFILHCGSWNAKPSCQYEMLCGLSFHSKKVTTTFCFWDRPLNEHADAWQALPFSKFHSHTKSMIFDKNAARK